MTVSKMEGNTNIRNLGHLYMKAKQNLEARQKNQILKLQAWKVLRFYFFLLIFKKISLIKHLA